LCQKLENLSPLALEAAKKALFTAEKDNKDERLKTERELFVELLKTDDAKEGMRAFFEKRPPVFRGS